MKFSNHLIKNKFLGVTTYMFQYIICKLGNTYFDPLGKEVFSGIFVKYFQESITLVNTEIKNVY